MAVALFPGQGVQAPGMDRGLGDRSSEIFDTASGVLGVDVRELCATGSSGDATLASTRWAQPAVLVCSVASFREVNVERTFDIVAGHSVGEYAALVCGGAIDFTDALTLIATRAAATADIAHRTDGAMAAVLKIDVDAAVRLCAENGVSLAADNAAGQCVISGHSGLVTAAMSALEGTRAVAKRLEVDGAFHSPLMEPAVDVLADALSSVSIARPRLRFWSSTTATSLDDPEAIRRALLEQLTGCVRWRETVERIAAGGHSTFTDIGPGRVVGTLARRIVPGADVHCAADLRDAAVAAS